MFVEDLKREFYDNIKSSRVLVLVGLDVDAICAWKILQYLLQCDHVPYTVVPVSGWQDLEACYMEHSESASSVVLINCGCTEDIVEKLVPDNPQLVFYICDSHRPIDVANVYNQVQVKLLVNGSEVSDVPAYNEVYWDGQESDDEDDQRITEEVLERRREKRLWSEKRQKILFDYAQFTYHGTSAALKMFELAWKLSRDQNELLWLAIVGVTEQMLTARVDRDKYISDVSDLQLHVLRHNHRSEDDSSEPSVSSLRISFITDLRLSLYRHWTIYDSITHTAPIAAKFKYWSLKGRKKLQEFLADMGLPLVQCRQKYSSMDPKYRTEIADMIETSAKKYGYTATDFFSPTFSASFGYRSRFCAADYVHAVTALLHKPGNSPIVRFNEAFDSLSRKRVSELERAVQLAVTRLQAVGRTAQSLLDTGELMSAGPFLYATLSKGSGDGAYFTEGPGLEMLSQFALNAYVSQRGSRAAALPLVLLAPGGEPDTSALIGIPPLAEHEPKNFFGKAFAQAALHTASRLLQDSFSSHVAIIKTEDKTKFLDALIHILQ